MPVEEWTLTRLQRHIQGLYGQRDQSRGVEGTFMWFMEEVGELSAALRVKTSGTPADGQRPRHPVAEEFADVLAWLATLANVAGVDLTEAVSVKYGQACPGCHHSPCRCTGEKP